MVIIKVTNDHKQIVPGKNNVPPKRHAIKLSGGILEHELLINVFFNFCMAHPKIFNFLWFFLTYSSKLTLSAVCNTCFHIESHQQ